MGTRFLNVPAEVMFQAAVESLDAGARVWFGCDVDQARIGGILDDAFDYQRVLGVDVDTRLPAEERLRFRQTNMTHAMVLESYTADARGEVIEFRVENSWGPAVNDGYFRMSPGWFRNFVVEVVVPQRVLSSNLARAFREDPAIVLEPWDPLGAVL